MKEIPLFVRLFKNSSYRKLIQMKVQDLESERPFPSGEVVTG
jgi:hypothetical protein